MWINIEIEAKELAEVIKLTSRREPVKETPSGSDVLKDAIVSVFKASVREKFTPEKASDFPPMGGSHQ